MPKKNITQQKIAENSGKIYFKSIEGVIPFNMINKRQIQRVTVPAANKKLSIGISNPRKKAVLGTEEMKL